MKKILSIFTGLAVVGCVKASPLGESDAGRKHQFCNDFVEYAVDSIGVRAKKRYEDDIKLYNGLKEIYDTLTEKQKRLMVKPTQPVDYSQYYTQDYLKQSHYMEKCLSVIL